MPRSDHPVYSICSFNAAMLYRIPNHLNALRKQATGRSAGELMRDRIILEAKRLLVNAHKSIAEIQFRQQLVTSK